MIIQCILHAGFERLAAIETWISEKGFKCRICRPFSGEPLPETNSFDWLIIMGGPQSPLMINQYPYLNDEVQTIYKAVKHDKPVLGFCLGAQLIGEAFGAKTERSPHKEVGAYPIRLTDKGKSDPLLKGLPNSFPVILWHNDMPGLTTDATVLAVSDGCPRQIVRYAPKVYGFQCHPEPTRESIEIIVKHYKENMTPGIFVQNKEELFSANFFEINQKLFTILNNLEEIS